MSENTTIYRRFDARNTALYRHFAADGRLLYVGISDDVEARTAQHRASSPWFSEVTRTGIEWCLSRDHALALEAVAIRFEKPLHNAQQPGVIDCAGAGDLTMFMREEGLTQFALAEKLGVNQSYVCRIKQGKKRPSLEVAKAIESLSGGRVPLSCWALHPSLTPEAAR